MTRRNTAMICLFLDIDRRDLLMRLRGIPNPRRKRVYTALLLEAARF